MVKVVFCKWGKDQEVASLLRDCYILAPDTWDDYGYKTYFNIFVYKNGEQYGKYSRKVLFKEQEKIDSSSIFLEKLLDGRIYLEIEEIYQKYEFISLGSGYEELKKIFSENNDYIEILKVLNDVIYLENKEPESKLLELKKHPGFEKSLCRTQSYVKMWEEGKLLLFGEALKENRFDFEFAFELDEKKYDYIFNFNTMDLPHRINVLIGKNGSGKSQTLLALSTYFLDKQDAREKYKIDTSSEKHPNFISNMLVFAYNPHENFMVPRMNYKYDIEYKYLGLKRAKQLFDIELKTLLHSENLYKIIQKLSRSYDLVELGSKIISAINRDKYEKDIKNAHELIDEICEKCELEQEVFSSEWKIVSETLYQNIVDIDTPSYMTFSSFEDIYFKDKNNLERSIQIDDILYRDQIFKHINNAFECNAIALKFIDKDRTEKYDFQEFKINGDYLILEVESEKRNYIRHLDFNDFEKKLYFFNENKQIYLSSGQQTFVDLIINLLSLIKKESLILIDEPENTLHPNLEVDFMKILQGILNDFESFAIIATHSSIIAREVPTEFVHVIKFDKSKQPIIFQPTIKTFGAEIGTITNYVFEDIFKKEKPYEKWFLEEKENYESFEQFEEKYRAILSYDFLLYCKNSWNL